MDDGDRLITELLRFVELLRRMGLSVGSGQALDATRTLALVDLSRRDDVYAALRAVLLDAHVHEPAFAAAFDRFWRGLAPLIEQFNAPIVGYAPATESRGHGEENGNAAQQVVKRVITLGGELDEDEAPDEPGEEGEAAGQIVAYSASEALRQRDFAHLSPAELAEMRRLLSTMSFKPPMRRLRRTQPARHGALLDLRRVARRNLRYGGEVLVLPRRRHKVRPRPIALICDVSGSMDRYTRLLLRFLHAATQGLEGVETFVFGTRLTRITHQLRLRDPDRALDEVAREVHDISGGTRIGEAISAFNRHWARRVLGRGAIAVVISDGWDRGDPALLGAEMAHLQRFCYLMVWLNPLLGLEGYQPLTRGMTAALPYIDLFLPAHNLASLESLAALLARVSMAQPGSNRASHLLPRAG